MSFDFPVATANPNAIDAAFVEGAAPAFAATSATPPVQDGRRRLEITGPVLKQMEERRQALLAAQRGEAPPSPPAPLAAAPPPAVPPPPLAVPVDAVKTSQLNAALTPIYAAIQELTQNITDVVAYVNDREQAAETKRQTTTKSIVFSYDTVGSFEAFVEEVKPLPNSAYIVITLGVNMDKPRFLPKEGVACELLAEAFGGLRARIVPVGCDFEDRGRHYIVVIREDALKPAEKAEVVESGDVPDTAALTASVVAAERAVDRAIRTQPDMRLQPTEPPAPDEEMRLD